MYLLIDIIRHVQVNLDMTDHCTTDFCIWQTICLVPIRRISSIRLMYTTDFAYDGPIFLVPGVGHIQVHLYNILMQCHGITTSGGEMNSIICLKMAFYNYYFHKYLGGVLMGYF